MNSSKKKNNGDFINSRPKNQYQIRLLIFVYLITYYINIYYLCNYIKTYLCVYKYFLYTTAVPKTKNCIKLNNLTLRLYLK